VASTKRRKHADSFDPAMPIPGNATDQAAGLLVTTRRLIRHAELFGCECVYETATTYLSERELVDLKIALRRIADEHRKAKRPASWWQEVPRIDAADIALLRANGATPDEIAALIGRSRTAVYKALERHIKNQPRDHRPMEKSDVI
jgi:hypothetical protein